MAGKPKQKPSISVDMSSIEQALKDRAAAQAERLREKGYSDLLEYASGYDLSKEKADLKYFPRNVKASVFDAVSPYYGSEAEANLEAARAYAESLQGSKDALVKIDPSFYEQIKENKIPINERPGVAGYNVTNNEVHLPTPIEFGNDKLSFTEKERIMNNYGSELEVASAIRKSLPNAYRDVAEHELVHSLDKHVSFLRSTEGYYKALDQGDAYTAFPDVGYMGQDDHLVTGLSKVQREYYAMTGKRFETPDEYKAFIIDLAKSPDQKEKIAGFSEEAKRTLRSQLLNANAIAPYLDRKKAHEEDKSFFKWPFIKGAGGSMPFFEKSAQLIPALVNINPRSIPSA